MLRAIKEGSLLERPLETRDEVTAWLPPPRPVLTLPPAPAPVDLTFLALAPRSWHRSLPRSPDLSLGPRPRPAPSTT